MTNNQSASAIQQIESVKEECENLLERIKIFSPPDEKGNYPETFRLIATPMLYSAWERCFTLCHAITLRLIRDVTVTTSSLSAPLRTIWLLKSHFYRSLVDRLRTITDSTKIKKGEFSILCEFLPKLDDWLLNELDMTIDTGDLVMTFSNVNPDVVEINAHAIGIADFTQFKELRLGRLHDLVGQRNDIGHGAIIEPPTNDGFISLLEFTEKLVEDYCNVFIGWIQSKFPENPENQ
ncbi:MAG: MAE_28990/MAE_18760 family HEPN-like nuclease [Desulfomonilaceae bacterium]